MEICRLDIGYLCHGSVDDRPLWRLVNPRFQGYIGGEQD